MSMSIQPLTQEIMPVSQGEIVMAMDHEFIRKPGTKHVCTICGDDRMSPQHGAFSYQGSSRRLDNRFTYQKTNKSWRKRYLELLAPLDLPQPCSCIHVSGQISFPDAHKRDEGNHRFLIEKFLGDALQDGGYLENDDWASYRFMDLDLAPVVRGQQTTRLMIVGFL